MFKKKNEEPKAGHLLGRSQEDADAVNTVMYDPGEQHLDLTKGEKVRTTALLMAINYVGETICKDAQMFQALKMDGRALVPATTPHVLQSAIQFEMFLLGRYSQGEPAGSEQAMGEPAPIDAVDPSAADPGTPTTREEEF